MEEIKKIEEYLLQHKDEIYEHLKKLMEIKSISDNGDVCKNGSFMEKRLIVPLRSLGKMPFLKWQRPLPRQNLLLPSFFANFSRKGNTSHCFPLKAQIWLYHLCQRKP